MFVFTPEEEANDDDFAKRLASLGDVYVNEAFSVDHRSHASTVGIPQISPRLYGIVVGKGNSCIK